MIHEEAITRRRPRPRTHSCPLHVTLLHGRHGAQSHLGGRAMGSILSGFPCHPHHSAFPLLLLPSGTLLQVPLEAVHGQQCFLEDVWGNVHGSPLVHIATPYRCLVCLQWGAKLVNHHIPFPAGLILSSDPNGAPCSVP